MQSTFTRAIAAIVLSCTLASPTFALSPFAGTPAPWPDCVDTETGDVVPTVSTKTE